MKTVQEWFAEYNESHQDGLNKRIHWICVPAILFSIIGLLMYLSTALTAFVIVLSLIFYNALDKALLIALSVLMVAMAGLAYVLPVGLGFYVAVFVLAWIGQFYGHKVEGKKPSFFKDLQFLLIGPAWCMDAWLDKWLGKFYTSKNPQQNRYRDDRVRA